MSLPKWLLAGSIAIVGAVVASRWIQFRDVSAPSASTEGSLALAEPAALAESDSWYRELATQLQDQRTAAPISSEMSRAGEVSATQVSLRNAPLPESVAEFPQVDRLAELFSTEGAKLPIVETIRYSSSVPWLKGRPAWIADYAAHYHTSRHFIARSLNGKPDYFSQNVSIGSRFNVLKSDHALQFYLLVDLSRCKMGLIYYDQTTDERVWLKTYAIAAGHPDPQSTSGYATPLGTYALGSKVAIYKPGTSGYVQGHKTEMVRVFGTRWLPFGDEVEGCTAPARGLGINGIPWTEQTDTGLLAEDLSALGHYATNGCIWMGANDIEELFSIVISRPTQIVLVDDFRQVQLPGKER